MAASILQEGQREALKKTRKATCWDPLQLLVRDVAGEPGNFSKIVDQVTAASVAPSAVFLLNPREVVKTKEDEYWPGYKVIKRQDILAQVQLSRDLQFQEFQGKKYKRML